MIHRFTKYSIIDVIPNPSEPRVRNLLFACGCKHLRAIHNFE